MAYATGVAATADALLQALGTFLTGNGWSFTTFAEMTGTTADTSVATGYTIYSYTDPTGWIFNIRPLASSLEMNIASGQNLHRSMQYQPGANNKNNCAVSPMTYPLISYHLFFMNNAVNVAMEVTANVFFHMNFGSLTKNGAWSGGKYVTGTTWRGASVNGYQFDSYTYGNAYPFGTGSAVLGAPISPASYNSFGFMTQNVGSTGYSYFGGSDTMDLGLVCPEMTTNGRVILDNSPNTFNDRAAMNPVTVTMTSTVDRLAPLYQMGYVPNACFVNIRDLDPKTVVNTNWMVFPLNEKNGNNTTYGNTGNYGIAYRK